MNKLIYRIISLITVLVLFVGLVSCASGGNPESPETGDSLATDSSTGDSVEVMNDVESELFDGLNTYLADPDPSKITGNKAATFVPDPNNPGYVQVSMEVTPESLRTENPSEVRYLIRRTEYAEIVGQYETSTSITGMAYQWRYVIVVEDLLNNGTLDAAEFWGGEPPEVKTSEESAYGTRPDEAEINAWIIQTINNFVFVDKATLYVKVPEGWGAPYVEYNDSKSLTGSLQIDPLITNGDWYTVIIPKWASELIVTSFPGDRGKDNYHSTTEPFEMPDGDAWIIVHDSEGNYTHYDYAHED